MKKILFIISMTFIFSADIWDLKGVKGFEFGMSKTQCYKNETVDFDYSSLEDLITSFSDITTMAQAKKYEILLGTFKTKFSNYNADGTLYLNDDKGLFGILFTLSLDTSNDNNYIDAYFKIKDLLIKKYGDPTNTNEYLEYPYKADFPRGDHAGQALSLGKGRYGSIFKCENDPNKYIQLLLAGDNYKMGFYLAYYDNNYDKTEENKLIETLDEF